jgi:hypothetical protein
VTTGILTLLMLGAVLLHVWWHHTGAVELRDETFNIALASLTLPIFMSVSRQVARTRQRLVEQKSSLRRPSRPCAPRPRAMPSPVWATGAA